MVKIAIIFHSKYGHTEQQAKAVLAGAECVQNIEARLIAVDKFQENIDFVNESDAIIFGSPTYMGTISAEFKVFMDATSKIWFKQQWKDKLAAGFTNSGWPSGDKLNTMNQMSIFAAQHGMIWISLGLIPGNLLHDPEKAEINRLGSFLGAMACSEFNQKPENSPPPCDLETAKFLGEMVAYSAVRWAAGKKDMSNV